MLEIGLQRSNMWYSCLIHSHPMSVQCGPTSPLARVCAWAARCWCVVSIICPRLGSWGGSCRLSLTGGAAAQLESDVRFQFETLKPKAPQVGWGAPLREPVRRERPVRPKSGVKSVQPAPEPNWLGFDPCQLFRSAGRGLTLVGCSQRGTGSLSKPLPGDREPAPHWAGRGAPEQARPPVGVPEAAAAGAPRSAQG